MLLSCYQNTIVCHQCLRLLPPSEYSGGTMDVSDAAQIKCTRSHIPTPDMGFGKHKLIPPNVSLLQNLNQNEHMFESAASFPKTKKRLKMLLKPSTAKRTMWT
jgi:hypothetical protein